MNSKKSRFWYKWISDGMVPSSRASKLLYREPSTDLDLNPVRFQLCLLILGKVLAESYPFPEHPPSINRSILLLIILLVDV
jgi:hypothetical protein